MKETRARPARVFTFDLSASYDGPALCYPLLTDANRQGRMMQMAKAFQGEPGTMRSALIVDDHPLFCDALSMTLKAFVGIAEIDTADRLERALAKLDSGAAPDVIVLDLNLPDVNGMDGLVRLHKAAGVTPIVVVSSMSDAKVIGAALQAGAAGFVPKHSQREVFRAAFAAIAAGQRFTPEGHVADAKGQGAHQDVIARLNLLTRQQAKILQEVCEGKLNKQIAFDLSIAETTVKAHVTAIMRKLGVSSRTQAVLIAREANFTSLLSDNG